MIEFDEKFFENLPGDPYEASFELLTRVKNSILAGHPQEAEYSAACGIFEAFYDANDFKKPERIGPRGTFAMMKDESADDAIERSRAGWRLQYEGYHNQIMANHAFAIKKRAKDSLLSVTKSSVGYAILTADEKKSIHSHIEKIRTIIEKSGLEDRKKNSLFDSLVGLLKEVNRNGTRTDRFFAFVSDAGFYAGEFADNAKPLFQELRGLLHEVTRARARTEGIKLPPGDEILSLPTPTND
jgi:hypothetical protein